MEFLVAIWGHCQSNQRGEFWAGADADYVEMICRWDGEAGVLFKALVECGRPGFMEAVDGGVVVHDWAEMNSQTVHNWARNTNGRKGKKPTGSQCEPVGSPMPNRTVKGGSVAGSEGEGDGSQREPVGSPMLTPTGSQCEPNKLSVYPSIIPSVLPEAAGPAAKGLRYDLAAEVVAWLNELTGAQFRGTHAELTAIAQCLHLVEQDVDGVKKMVRRQVTLWKDDAKSAAWLRPLTLFDDQKFEGYYAQRDLPVTATGRGFDQKKPGGPGRGELLQQLTQARQMGDTGAVAELEKQLATLPAN